MRCWTQLPLLPVTAWARIERNDEEDPHAEDEGQPEHQGHGALAELARTVLVGCLEVRAADQPAGAHDERLVQDDEAAHERGRGEPPAMRPGVQRLRCPDDAPVRVAEGDRDRVASAHEDALDERLSAVVEPCHAGKSTGGPRKSRRRSADRRSAAGDVPARRAAAPQPARTWRSRRFWNRSTWPAVSMIVCLPVKNGWQFPQTSTRSSGRVEPTVHSVPQEPQ